MSDPRIRLLVVDDSATIRSMLTQILDAQPDMEVVGTASRGYEGVRRATELQPDITLMDVHLPDLDGIQATWLLANKVPYGAVVMVTSEERVDFLQKAMMAGAKAYVLKPFGDGTQLLQTIRDVHTWVSHRRGEARLTPTEAVRPAPIRLGKRIAVFGAKGGVGRTTVAVGLALALKQAAADQSVMLFDGDFLFGDAAIHLDLSLERTLLDLVPHMDALDSDMISAVTVTHSSGVDVLPPPPRPEQAEVLTADHVRTVLSSLAQMYHYVVMDMQASYDDRMLAMLDLADVYVIVLTPHIGVLRNTSHFLEVAKVLGYDEERMCFVLNNASTLAGLHLDGIAKTLGTRRIFQIPTDGPELTQAINEGRPYLESQPKAPLSKAIVSLADHVRRLAG